MFKSLIAPRYTLGDTDVFLSFIKILDDDGSADVIVIERIIDDKQKPDLELLTLPIESPGEMVIRKKFFSLEGIFLGLNSSTMFVKLTINISIEQLAKLEKLKSAIKNPIFTLDKCIFTKECWVERFFRALGIIDIDLGSRRTMASISSGVFFEPTLFISQLLHKPVIYSSVFDPESKCAIELFSVTELKLIKDRNPLPQKAIIIERVTTRLNRRIAEIYFQDRCYIEIELGQDLNSRKIYQKLSTLGYLDTKTTRSNTYSITVEEKQKLLDSWFLVAKELADGEKPTTSTAIPVESFVGMAANVHPGLQHQTIDGDGDCLYMAVTYYLSHGEDVTFLRKIVAANLEGNVARYGKFVPLRDEQSLQDYIASIKSKHEWAGELEINILMRLLDCPIVIIGPEGTIRNKEEVNKYLDRDPIFVFYNGGDERGSSKPGHYDVLILRDGYNGKTILAEMLSPTYDLRVSQTFPSALSPAASSAPPAPSTQATTSAPY